MTKEEILKLLEKFTFVMWDRFTEEDGFYVFYGWIERKDKYKDFLVITIDGEFTWFCTSSAKYSNLIDKILSFPTVSKQHNKCIRVESKFEIKNSIKK